MENEKGKANKTRRMDTTIDVAGQADSSRIRTLHYKEKDPTFKDHSEILYDGE